jgi:hypothetical protein
LLLPVFLVLAVVTTAQTVLSRRASGESGEFWSTVVYSAATWAAWVVLIPAILWLGRRFDFRRERRTASILVHVGAAFLAHSLTMGLSLVLGIALYSPDESITMEMVQRVVLLSGRLPLSFITYAGILGLDRALAVWSALAEREVQSARLRAQATQARLEALASRLQPHFLFNALQSVSALIDEDPARARSMLALLGDLLRDVLAAPDDGEVPLHDEIALLRRYLAIEEIRFADRLRVRYDVSEEVARVAVPRLLLQPLAENALRHGLAPLPEGGTLTIAAHPGARGVTIRVHNTGLPIPTSTRQGVGLAMTRERLAARHGDAAAFTLRPASEGGVEAVVELPR